MIGECLESEQLFEGTLLENIATGRPNATFANVKWAVENLGLTPFLKTLPNGYQTRIDPQGKKLPWSTVQKILLARSIAIQPKLLVLENILEAMNPDEIIRIVDFLTHPDRPWTMVAVSSNHYLASKVDQIAVVQEGSVRATGNYTELDSSLIPQISASA